MLESWAVYTDALSDGHTLEVFQDGRMVFSSSGRWLHPLFMLEGFIKENGIDPSSLSVHDSVSGIAAAAITIHLGVGRIHADLMSEGADRMYAIHGMEHSYGKLTERIKCITESMIDPSDPVDESYIRLRKKADLASGLRLEVKGLSFSYGEKRILDDVSFILNPGDTVILEGENGSGKTTLLRCMLSLLRHTGTVLFDGKEGVRDTAYIKQSIDSEPFPLSAGEVVGLSVPKGRDRKAEVELAMRRTGCFSLRERSYYTLSGGEKAKVNISRALAAGSRLLILDEPSAALDKESRREFAALLRSLQFGEMPTMLIVSHDPDLSEALGWPRLRLEGGRLA